MKRSLTLIALAAVAAFSILPASAADEVLEMMSGQPSIAVIPVEHSCPTEHEHLFRSFEDFIHAHAGDMNQRMFLFMQSEPGNDRSEVLAILYHAEYRGDTWRYTRTISNLSAHTIDYMFFQPPAKEGLHQVQKLATGTLAPCMHSSTTMESSAAPLDRFEYISMLAKDESGKAVWVGKFKEDPAEDTMNAFIEGAILPPEQDFQ